VEELAERAGFVDGVGTTTVGYDDAGRRATETGPDGTRTTYRWNALDQLTAIERTAPSGTTERVTIDVDALGRPQRISGRSVGYDPIAGAPNLIGDVRIITVGALSWRSDDESWDRPAPGTPEGLRIGGLTVLSARTYDPVTRQFLSPDPLATVPATNGAASAYTYAWQDPVDYIDPTRMQPVSIEAYEAIHRCEEHGRLGQAWEAVKEDPWGTLAAVAVVAVGVGLLFVPGGQVIGAGILIGAGVSVAAGLATGTFDPRAVAVSGLIGGAVVGQVLRSRRPARQWQLAERSGSGATLRCRQHRGRPSTGIDPSSPVEFASSPRESANRRVRIRTLRSGQPQPVRPPTLAPDRCHGEPSRRGFVAKRVEARSRRPEPRRRCHGMSP